MYKKIILYGVISLFALGVLFICFKYLEKNKVAKESGNIEVYLIDLDGNILENEKIVYQKGDTLVGVLKNKFNNFKMNKNGFLQSIGNLEETKTQEKWIYISIIVNEEYSTKGLSQLRLEDGMVIKFILEEYLYE